MPERVRRLVDGTIHVAAWDEGGWYIGLRENDKSIFVKKMLPDEKPKFYRGGVMFIIDRWDINSR